MLAGSIVSLAEVPGKKLPTTKLACHPSQMAPRALVKSDPKSKGPGRKRGLAQPGQGGGGNQGANSACGSNSSSQAMRGDSQGWNLKEDSDTASNSASADISSDPTRTVAVMDCVPSAAGNGVGGTGEQHSLGGVGAGSGAAFH